MPMRSKRRSREEAQWEAGHRIFARYVVCLIAGYIVLAYFPGGVELSELTFYGDI